MKATQRIDKWTEQLECDACGKPMHVNDTHSFITVIGIAYAITGQHEPGATLEAFQCPYEQHFGCSFDCAVKAHEECLHTHLKPEWEKRMERLQNGDQSNTV
jgi:hypothetical protein